MNELKETVDNLLDKYNIGTEKVIDDFDIVYKIKNFNEDDFNSFRKEIENIIGYDRFHFIDDFIEFFITYDDTLITFKQGWQVFDSLNHGLNRHVKNLLIKNVKKYHKPISICEI